MGTIKTWTIFIFAIRAAWAVVLCEGAAGWGRGFIFSHIVSSGTRIRNDALE